MKFRKIEALLDEALTASLPFLKNDGIDYSTRSITCYSYKAFDREWVHDFYKGWNINHEIASTRVTVCFHEYTLPNEIINVEIMSAIYYGETYTYSRSKINKSFEIEIEELLSLGLYKFLNDIFSSYKTELEEHM